ncbi:MAG: transglutaminase-like domain-containing protein [Flavobacteriales bacterium]|nr:transglutaminase-like domain-containing protein [Flavobacteriales bacterium]
MKKITLSLVLLCVTLFTSAQNLTKEHSDYYQKMHSQLIELRKSKDFSKMIDLSYQKIGFIISLPESELPVKNKKSAFMGEYYNLACFLSMNGQKEDAIDAFENSVNLGYRNYKWATKDTDLDSLRTDARFEKQIQILKEKYDYTTLLKNSGEYRKDTASLPPFTYLDKNAPELKNLRKTLKLDSIAGRGDELSKIKNLLHYIHTAVRHDGSSSNPKSKNAIDLINICKKENRGINCRMMATALAECYMAMGMPARFITCLPQDKEDQDCHVITIVWSKKLNKWIWADPTFNAMMYDDKGTPLNPQEVRELFIAEKDSSVHMSKDANWNGQKKDEGDYFDYMKKNLYWIQSPFDNGYDIETIKEGKERPYYLNLVSGDFKPWANDYLTHSPEVFWAAPITKK